MPACPACEQPPTERGQHHAFGEATQRVVGSGKKYSENLEIIEEWVLEKGMTGTHPIPIAQIAEVRPSSIGGIWGSVKIRTIFGREYEPTISRKKAEEFVADIKAIRDLARTGMRGVGADAKVSPTPQSPAALTPGGHRFCGRCGTRAGPKARFCGSCGAPLRPAEHPIQ
jgi:hypothetical protein